MSSTDQPDPLETSTDHPALPIIRRVLQVVIPVAALVCGYLIMRHLVLNPPVARTRPVTAAVAQIVVRPATTTDFTIQLESRGTVQARTTSNLVARVNGVVLEIAPSFAVGGYVRAGETLVRLDARDYEVAVAQAKAARDKASTDLDRVRIEVQQYETAFRVAQSEIATTRLALANEEAQAEQAIQEWRGLNGETPAPPLVRRVPQLAAASATAKSAEARAAQADANRALAKPLVAAATASLAAAEAALERAELDLSRTTLTAPFDGRLESRRVNVGQFVNSGTSLATLYATDVAEVRLPLSGRQLAYLELPEADAVATAAETDFPAVTLTARYGDATWTWEGRVVRTEGVMEASTRQLFVVAEVPEPLRIRTPGQPPLRVGEFVTATITGRTLKDVVVIDRRHVRSGDTLHVLDAERYLVPRHIVPIWNDNDVVLLREGLAHGEYYSTTPVVFAGDRLAVEAQVDGGTQVLRSAGLPPPGGAGEKKGGAGESAGTGGGAKPKGTTPAAAVPAGAAVPSPKAEAAP